jgi:thiol:disulfide interchange protein DsbD
MLKAIFLLLFSTLTFASDHAGFSLQRWNNKLVVTINHDKGWHTYWKNPGDAGIASSFKFYKGNSELNLKSFEWPTPKLYVEAGDIQTIGYAGKQHFFFDAHEGHIKAVINVLICKDICIPGSATLLLGESEQFTSDRREKPATNEELEKKFSELPAPGQLPEGFEYYLTRTKDKNELVLHYSLPNVSSPELSHKLSLLTSFPMNPFTFKRESVYFKDGVLYGKTTIDWDGEYLDPPVALPENGKFAQNYQIPFLFNPPGKGDVTVVNLTFSDFSVGYEALDQFYKSLEASTPPQSTENAGAATFVTYMILAFLGGLILNLMPCVLPVISLKLFSLIKYQDSSRKKLLRHNLFFTMGVISTLLALASVVVALKAGGEEIGWGFQLQSPSFILFMMLLLFIMTMNMFGLFEFKTPGGSKLGSAEVKDSIWGDFFTGVLTTILSTPCSAPFLGTALTFAFTTSYFTVYLIFVFIGLGISFPFLLTALFPSTLKFLPRPGMWMEKLKYVLGFTLLVTTIWLYDVFVSLVDFDLISWRVNLLFACWFFLFFFSKKVKNRFVPATLIVLTLGLTLVAFKDLKLRSQPSAIHTTSKWTPWSEAKLTELKGEVVFMDFTAEWCLTCKVNKKLVLETSAFEEMAAREGIKLLRADWTKRDDHITQFLRRHNVVGVPAYFVQKKDGTIVHLGETISVSKVEKNIK